MNMYHAVGLMISVLAVSLTFLFLSSNLVFAQTPALLPIAFASASQTDAKGGTLITLDGAQSLDFQGEKLKFSWSQIAGPPVIVYGAGYDEAVFTTPLDVTADLVFALVVSDHNHESGPALVTVHVTQNDKISIPVRQWGSYCDLPVITGVPITGSLGPGCIGNGDGQFNLIKGIAIDRLDNVYVADSGNSRIEKFSKDGTLLTKWGSYCNLVGGFNCIDPDGNGPLQLGDTQGHPVAIATDPQLNVYVIDDANSRVEKFTSDGKFLTKWGSLGVDPGQFFLPSGIAVDSSDNVYVSDSGNNRIEKFDGNGNFLKEWKPPPNDSHLPFFPIGIAVDPSGNVFVVDQSNIKIDKFTNDGNFLKTWGGFCDVQIINNVPVDGDNCQPGTTFNLPGYIAIDSLGNVYVTDLGIRHVQEFSNNGDFKGKWGSFCNSYTLDGCVDPDGNGPQGLGDGQFFRPMGIAIDSDNRVYVADFERIEKFTLDYADLILTGAEPIQGPNETNPMIAGKDTLVKVSIVSGFVKDQLVKIQYHYDMEDNDGTTISVTNSEFQTVKFGKNEFYLPSDSVIVPSKGQFTTTATIDPDNTIHEVDEKNNENIPLVSFVQESKPLSILYVPILLPGDTSYPSCSEMEKIATSQSEYLKGIFPVANDKLTIDWSCIPPSLPDVHPVNGKIDPVQAFIGGATFDRTAENKLFDDLNKFISIPSPAIAGGKKFDKIVAIGNPGWFKAHVNTAKDALGFAFIKNNNAAVVENSDYNDKAITHELIHTFNWVTDPNIVDPKSKAHTLNLASPGFWVDARQEFSADEAVDIMNTTLASSEWISSETWDHLASNLKDPLDPKVIQISGILYKNGTTKLDPWYIFNSTEDISLGTKGNVTILYLDKNDKTINSTGFDIDFVGPHLVPSDVAYFIKNIPDVPGTATIVIKNSTLVLAQREISPNTPEIKILTPNGGEVFSTGQTVNVTWNATDKDNPDGGDSGLSYRLFLSNDNGTSWLPLAVDLTERKFSFVVPQGLVSNSSLVLVSASDGINTATDTSDTTFRIVSGNQTGSIPTGDIIVADSADSTIFRVNPTNGTQKIISTGHFLQDPLGVAIDSIHNILVADLLSPGRLISINPTSGVQSVISSGGWAPSGIITTKDGKIVLADLSLPGITSVNPITGVRTPISSKGFFVSPGEIAIDSQGNFIISDERAFGGNGGIIKVDSTNGTQTAVSSGGLFHTPKGIVIDSDGNYIVANSGFGVTGSQSILKVDPLTGLQSVISSGGKLVHPIGISLDSVGNIIATDPGANKVLCIDPASGSQRVISSGGLFGNIYAVTTSGEVNCNPPPSMVTISEPVNGSLLTNNEIQLKGTSSSFSGIKNVKVFIDGILTGTANGTTSWSFVKTGVSEGHHTLLVTALDNSGKSVSSSVSVIVDSTKPSVNISYPPDDAIFNQTSNLNINGTSSDSTSGVRLVFVEIDNGSFELASGTLSWTATNIPSLSDGPHIITAKAYDDAGNSDVTRHTIFITTGNPGHPPIAQNDIATTLQGNPVDINVLHNDSDPDADKLSIFSVSLPKHGDAIMELNGSENIQYVPSQDFFGNDNFTYTITDGNGGISNATVSVSISSKNSTENSNLFCGKPQRSYAHVINGTNGNDILNGTNDSDLIIGNGGNDIINGNGGDDCILGGSGNDIINGGPGNDNINGGSGDDTLVGGPGNDTINGSTGNDIIDGGTGDDNLIGGPGNDTINGSDGNDVIDGGTGDDKIYGGNGNDTINGSDGNDYLQGSGGNDKIYGGAGDDEIHGGDGNDYIQGSDGNDKLYGGAGDDELHGGAGDDYLNSGDGTDKCFDTLGNNTKINCES